jgi:hypothetical protein
METNEIEEKIKHLKIIMQKIESWARYESDFDRLYKLLQNEYELNGGDDAEYVMKNYRHRLEQIIDKEAQNYIKTKKKRPKKGAPSEYAAFINIFSSEVRSELFWWECKLNPSSHK